MFFERGTYGGVDWSAATLDNFVRAFDPLYLSIFLDSARIALVATALALLIGYPAAYAIMKAPERWQTSLLFLAILPFWTNYLIRTYAWIVLLNPVGVINNILMYLGVISRRCQFSTMNSPSSSALSTITHPSSSSPSIRRCKGLIPPMRKPHVISAPRP